MSKQEKMNQLYTMCLNFLKNHNPSLLEEGDKDKIYFYLMGALEAKGVPGAAAIASAFARHPNAPGAFSQSLDYLYAVGLLK